MRKVPDQFGPGLATKLLSSFQLGCIHSEQSRHALLPQVVDSRLRPFVFGVTFWLRIESSRGYVAWRQLVYVNQRLSKREVSCVSTFSHRSGFVAREWNQYLPLVKG